MDCPRRLCSCTDICDSALRNVHLHRGIPQPAVDLCSHRLQQRGETEETPMTLKPFYSYNHRLPSPWIYAVTLAPACLPPGYYCWGPGRGCVQLSGKGFESLSFTNREERDAESQNGKQIIERDKKHKAISY